VSVQTIYGETRNRDIALELEVQLKTLVTEGTIYLGYPVLASADKTVYVDALLVGQEHGLVAFQLAEGVPATIDDWSKYVMEQDRLFGALESHLGRHDTLRRGRRLSFDIQTVTVFSAIPTPAPATAEGAYCEIGHVAKVVAAFPAIDEGVEKALQAAIQRVTTIKPAKRRDKVIDDGSRGAVLKKIEKGIANLDEWQKRAAIETPEGPQRVRGLAGSGKTIVLALKAAYLHAQHPDWRVAVTFWSRALYQQLEDLVTRFSFEHSNDKPDFSRLQLLHGWGSSSRDGMYTTMARAADAPPRDFNYARSTFGSGDAFKGVCAELLALTSQNPPQPIFDAVLIDEAQDFPPEFFQLVYRFTKDPKRIVWAFDELQKLSEAAMPSTRELFGTTHTGDDVVTITNKEGEARRDIVLPVCYRNSPWALVTAHAVGLGIYREAGLVQHFDDPQLWDEIGYHVLEGALEPGSWVRMERSRTSYPDFFLDLLDEKDAVVLQTFADETEQDLWVAEQIAVNLDKDELEHDDILVVLPEAYTSKRRSWRFSERLQRYGIDSHLAGVGSSVDELFVQESVAIANIFRAKGNEAPMVYVLDSQYAAQGTNQITRRNTLFTAITRSRAWVRICGFGSHIDEIAKEVKTVRAHDFHLQFTIPTMEELADLRRIHRDRTGAEVASVKRATRNIRELLTAFERDEIDLDDLPPDLRTRLLKLMRQELENGSY